MAGGTLLQMDQAAPAHQILLRHLRECRQDPNLDRHLGLCACRHPQETTRLQGRSLHNFSGSQPDPV